MLGMPATFRSKKSLYDFAREGMWPVVYAKLSQFPSWVDKVDGFKQTSGWTLLDHALYQQRLDVIQTLQTTFQLQAFANKASIVVHYAYSGNWVWIQQLLNEKLIKIDDEYYDPIRNYYMLLDIAVSQNNQGMIAILRQKYGALTLKENAIAIATRQMFAAAKMAHWPIVYQLLDEKLTTVDMIDRSDAKGRVLLHFAYEQGNQMAFLKLLTHYGASLAEICQDDPAWYERMIDFYDICRSLRQDPMTSRLTVQPIVPGYRQVQQTRGVANKSAASISHITRGLSQLAIDFPNGEDVPYYPNTRKR